jgi:hypothetical protein
MRPASNTATRAPRAASSGAISRERPPPCEHHVPLGAVRGLGGRRAFRGGLSASGLQGVEAVEAVEQLVAAARADDVAGVCDHDTCPVAGTGDRAGQVETESSRNRISCAGGGPSSASITSDANRAQRSSQSFRSADVCARLSMLLPPRRRITRPMSA